MSAQKPCPLFAVVLFLTLMGNLMFPTSAHADDLAPTPPPTEETISTEEENQTIPTEIGTPPPESAAEPAPVSEILDQLPQDTELVVLNENGEVLPLASQTAADAIMTGDPVWCPSTLAAPTPGANGCTASYTSLQALLSYLNANQPAMDGTIWIESSYNSSVNDSVAGFSIHGASFTTMRDYALTIQGGWDGVSGSSAIGSPSLFVNDYLFISSWNNAVTINNISISGSFGIEVSTTGDINLNHVTSANNSYGAALDNCALSISFCTGSGNISLNNVTFNNNTSNGAQALSNGNVSVTNITANNNGNIGLVVNNETFTTGANNVTIGGNNQFNSNASTGMLVYSSGNVSIGGSQMNNNGLYGLYASAAGNMTLNNITANENGGTGVYFDSGDHVTASGISASNNMAHGILGFANEQLTLSNFVANQNAYGGVILDFGSSSYMNNGQANNNGWEGAVLSSSSGNILVENVIVDGNSEGAVFLTSGVVNVTCSAFSNNTDHGILVNAPEINLFGVTLSNNGTDVTATGTVNIFDVPCVPDLNGGGKPKTPGGAGLPLNIVQGGSAELRCDKFSGTVLVLPNGDKVTFKCPIRGSASATRLAEDGLPGALPEGVEYVSGLNAIQSPDGSDVALNGLVIVSFLIPEEMQGENFAILYWNEAEWVELSAAAFDDGRIVVNGGYFTSDGYFEAVTNFSGNFALVKK